MLQVETETERGDEGLTARMDVWPDARSRGRGNSLNPCGHPTSSTQGFAVHAYPVDDNAREQEGGTAGGRREKERGSGAE